MKIETVQTIARVLDILSLLVVLGVGVFAILKPDKFWKVTQNRRNKDTEPTYKAINSTRIIGMFAVAFSIVVLITTIKPMIV